MKLGVVKRIGRDELQKAGGEIPAWVDVFLNSINSFIEKVGLALQGKLTFEDNFFCKSIYLDFTHGVEQLINPAVANAINARVIGVLPLDASGQGVDSFKWVRKDDGNIGVTYSFAGGSSSTKAKCRLIILLGGD